MSCRSPAASHVRRTCVQLHRCRAWAPSGTSHLCACAWWMQIEVRGSACGGGPGGRQQLHRQRRQCPERCSHARLHDPTRGVLEVARPRARNALAAVSVRAQCLASHPRRKAENRAVCTRRGLQSRAASAATGSVGAEPNVPPSPPFGASATARAPRNLIVLSYVLANHAPRPDRSARRPPSPSVCVLCIRRARVPDRQLVGQQPKVPRTSPAGVVRSAKLQDTPFCGSFDERP